MFLSFSCGTDWYEGCRAGFSCKHTLPPSLSLIFQPVFLLLALPSSLSLCSVSFLPCSFSKSLSLICPNTLFVALPSSLSLMCPLFSLARFPRLSLSLLFVPNFISLVFPSYLSLLSLTSSCLSLARFPKP